MSYCIAALRRAGSLQKAAVELALLHDIERYRQAAEYMTWFRPAWKKLSSDEQYVLQTFYADEDAQTSAVYAIADHFHIERSSAYKRKNRALAKFAILLFGKT